MVRRPATQLALIAAFCAVSEPASAYRIRHMGAQHEIFTVLAETCVRQRGERVLREKCGWPETLKKFDETPYEHSSWGESVRWPDDPTRRAYSLQMIKLFYNLSLGGCRRRLARPRYPSLLCDSDMGRLQFLHAMRPADDSDWDTRWRILAWTQFSFRVATGQVNGAVNLCSEVKKYPGLEGAFWGRKDSRVQRDVSKPYCLDPNRTPGPNVSHFFASTCKRACTIPERADEVTRKTALGAIMHLIQDSFSQSHAARGGIFHYGPFSARVVCLPVEQFYNYDAAQATVHGPGDRTPTFDIGCASSTIIDPITATARLLWLYNHGCDSSWAVELVDYGVLGGARPARVPASPQQCRMPTEGA